MVSARFLLDTNVISEPIRPEPDRNVLRKLQLHEGALAIPAPVWHELVYGWHRLPASRKRNLIEKYLFETVLGSIEILPYDTRAAEWHAGERARLQAAGRVPPFVDGQIAAVAKVNDLVLVTANRPDFQDFDGLVVEDWRG